MYGERFDNAGDAVNAASTKEDAQDDDPPEKVTTKGTDIEREIKGELEALQNERRGPNSSSSNSTPKVDATSAAATGGRKQLFTHVRLNLQCGK